MSKILAIVIQKINGQIEITNRLNKKMNSILLYQIFKK